MGFKGVGGARAQLLQKTKNTTAKTTCKSSNSKPKPVFSCCNHPLDSFITAESRDDIAEPYFTDAAVILRAQFNFTVPHTKPYRRCFVHHLTGFSLGTHHLRRRRFLTYQLGSALSQHPRASSTSRKFVVQILKKKTKLISGHTILVGG
ncbi:hypothetical protein M0R45_014770 [Rubus argutus]|uniref:Uncharacterized protein n=1 Tax=Rubus argutus TaxID=59490 RepID=A0AAW1XMJ7_RUBAR